MTKINNTIKFVSLVVAVYASYLVYGTAQEKITKGLFGPSQRKWKYSMSLIWIQFIFQTLVAYIFLNAIKANKGKGKKFNFRESINDKSVQIQHLGSTYEFYTYCALSSGLAMLSTNIALKHIDYPSQILVKSCKILAVLLAQVLFLKKSFPKSQYLSVTLLTLGILVFSFSRMKNSADKESTTIGYVFLFLSLFFDGVTSCVQETTVKKHNPTPMQMMFIINLISLLIATIAVFATGEIFVAIKLIKSDIALLKHIIVYGISASCGQALIFSLVSNYGSLVTVIVTTTRKFFSILLSVVIFKHQMNTLAWIGVILVFCGLTININKKQQKPKTT